MDALFWNSSDQFGVTSSAASVYLWPPSIPPNRDQEDLFLEALLNGNVNEISPTMEYPMAPQLTNPAMAMVDSTEINSTAVYSKTDNYNLESLTQVRSYTDLVQSGNISMVNTATINPNITTMEGLSTTTDSVVSSAVDSGDQSFEQLQNGYEMPSFIVKKSYNVIPQMAEGKGPQTNYKMEGISSSSMKPNTNRAEMDMSKSFFVDHDGEKLKSSGPMLYASENHLPAVSATEKTNNSEDSGQTRSDALREMIYMLSTMQPVTIDPCTIVRPKRRNVRISSDPQSVAARRRRERISDRIRILQRLVPGGAKMDTASMLDEAIHYVKFLQKQVQVLESATSKFYDHPWNYRKQHQPSSSSYNAKLLNPITCSPSLTLPINTAAPNPMVDCNMNDAKPHLQRAYNYDN